MHVLLLLTEQALLCVALVSGVPLLVCSVSGLIVSIVQAATSVQEQTSVFIVKLLALGVSVFVLGDVLLNSLSVFVVNALGALGSFGLQR